MPDFLSGTEEKNEGRKICILTSSLNGTAGAFRDLQLQPEVAKTFLFYDVEAVCGLKGKGKRMTEGLTEGHSRTSEKMQKNEEFIFLLIMLTLFLTSLFHNDPSGRVKHAFLLSSFS